MKYKLLITSLLLAVPCTAFANDISLDVGGMHLSIDSSAEGDDVNMIMDDGTRLNVSGEDIEVDSDNNENDMDVDSDDDDDMDMDMDDDEDMEDLD